VIKLDLTNVAYTNIKIKKELENIASAYDVWLSAGNEGSIQDFLLDIKGAPGDVSTEQMNTAINNALTDWGDLT